MQKLFALSVLLFLPTLTSAFAIPQTGPTAFVTDYASILSPNQINELELKISNFEKSTTNEIAVVTIPSLDGDTIENVAQDIFTKWGIGKEGKNNGVLLLISLADRETRIHTGYGVEGDLTDIGTSYIQRDIITPAFQAGDYYSGINGAVDKMIEALGGTQIVPESYYNDNVSIKNWGSIFIFGFIILQWIGAVLARSKSWWGGGVVGGVIGGALWLLGFWSLITSVIVFITLVVLGLGLDYVVSKTYQKVKASGSKHYPWWIGGGGFGGGGGAGGFGGFGGGFSGGGGSSGRW